MAFTKYPITDYNNLNLDWIIETLRSVTDQADLTAAGLTSETAEREAADSELRALIESLDPTIAGALYPLTPQLFGAKADGVTDDTASIQACIDAAHDQGRPVFFPRATYFVNTILFNAADYHTSHALRIYSGQSVIGDNAVIVTGEAVNHTLYTHNEAGAGGYNGAKNILIAGISFTRAAYANASTILNLSHGDNIAIRRCTFEGSTAWHQIEVNSSRNVSISECTFRAMYGVVLASTECIQFDAATGGGNLGLQDGTACVDCKVSGCKFLDIENCAIGSHSASTITNLIISDCILKAAADFARPFINFAEAVQVMVLGCYFEGVTNQETVVAKYAYTSGCVYDHAYPNNNASTGNGYDIANDFSIVTSGGYNTNITNRWNNLFQGAVNIAPVIGNEPDGPDQSVGVVFTGKPVNSYATMMMINALGRLFTKGINNGTESAWKEALTFQPRELDSLNQHNNIPLPGITGGFFLPTATGSPSSADSGFFMEIRNAGSGNYGSEIAVTNHGLFVRGYNNGTYSNWVTIASF